MGFFELTCQACWAVDNYFIIADARNLNIQQEGMHAALNRRSCSLGWVASNESEEKHRDCCSHIPAALVAIPARDEDLGQSQNQCGRVGGC